MANVNYLCCPTCKAWYRNGESHICDFLNGRDEDREIPGITGGLLYIRSFDPLIIPVPSDENPISEETEDGDIRIPKEPPVAVHQLINSERIYTLLERIAVALEKLVEK